jgi:uncharacterized RDD family membrane protein YckC
MPPLAEACLFILSPALRKSRNTTNFITQQLFMENDDISIFPDRIVYGTFWQRFGAALLDGLILMIPDMIIDKVFNVQNIFTEIANHNVNSTTICVMLTESLISLIYFSAMESSKSQATIGKQALSLKVTGIDHTRISFAKAFGRNFGKNLSTLILFIGYFMMLWDDDSQTLHDKMAGTLVVKK